jgi:hypothetical protein
MRLSVQKGGRYLAALMVALMLLWSLFLVIPGQADATTGHDTSGGYDQEDKDYKGDHHGDGGDCSPSHYGKSGGDKDDCDDHDGGECPSGHDGKSGGGKDDCDDHDGGECPSGHDGKSGGGKDDCDDHDGGECPSGHDGKSGGGKDDCDDDDDDCPVTSQSQGDHDDCDPDDDDCPVEHPGKDSGDDDDCDNETTTTTTIPGSSSTTTVAGVTVTTTLDIAAAGAECRRDIPYLGYDIDWPQGGTATITFVNPTGADIVHENMPLSGEVIWPGANHDPADWPGWILEDGVWVEGDDGFLWARGTIEVRFEVNPTALVQVSYPTTNVACAGPKNAPRPTVPDKVGGVTITPPPPPGDDVGGVTELPLTGIDPAPLAVSAFAVVALGALLVVAGRKEDFEKS